MKIHIDIDLEPSKNSKSDMDLARMIQGLDAILRAFESELENYRQRLERVEEMTTRFEARQEEG